MESQGIWPSGVSGEVDRSKNLEFNGGFLQLGRKGAAEI